jgi:hypothetical protein
MPASRGPAASCPTRLTHFYDSGIVQEGFSHWGRLGLIHSATDAKGDTQGGRANDSVAL